MGCGNTKGVEFGGTSQDRPEENFNCKQHGAPLQLFCADCKELICLNCVEVHSSKGCAYPKTLIAYVDERLLPKYSEQLGVLEAKSDTATVPLINFIYSASDVREKLLNLKAKLQSLLKNVDATLDLLGTKQKESSIIDSVHTKLKVEYAGFKKAIEKNNLDYITRRLHYKDCAVEIDDVDKILIDNLKSSVLQVTELKEFDSLSQLLVEYNKRNEKPTASDASVFESEIQCIYGICELAVARSVLHKYDIKSKTFTGTVAVPKCCSVTQILSRIFVTGGSDPIVDTVSEYIEKRKALIPKKMMTHRKYRHATQVISKDCFITAGGKQPYTDIKYCEAYSLKDNSWKELPQLNAARSCSGMAFLKKQFLYIFGGNFTDDKIEMLNMKEERAWVNIALPSNKLNLGASPAAFALSDTEVMILEGSGLNTARVFNANYSTAKKCGSDELYDSYSFNSVYTTGKKAYIIGDSGHIHIYDLGKGRFESIKYFDTIH